MLFDGTVIIVIVALAAVNFFFFFHLDLAYLSHRDPLLRRSIPLFQKINNEIAAIAASTLATTAKPPGMYETFSKLKPLMLNIPVTNERGSNTTENTVSILILSLILNDMLPAKTSRVEFIVSR